MNLKFFRTLTLPLEPENNSVYITKSLREGRFNLTVVGISGETKQIIDPVNISDVTSSLATKVDKVPGKTLSSNDFTPALRTKLNNIQSQATKNQTDTWLINRANHTGYQEISTIDGLQAELDGLVDIREGYGLSDVDYTTALKNKLSSIANQATKNLSDSQLVSRSRHTGSQAIQTVTGLQAALDAKVSVNGTKTLTTVDFTQTHLDKLNGIATGATANQGDAALRMRANHTGTQPINSITNLSQELSIRCTYVFNDTFSTAGGPTVASLGLGQGSIIINRVQPSVSFVNGTQTKAIKLTGTKIIRT